MDSSTPRKMAAFKTPTNAPKQLMNTIGGRIILIHANNLFINNLKNQKVIYLIIRKMKKNIEKIFILCSISKINVHRCINDGYD
jgi:hypothetical protein